MMKYLQENEKIESRRLYEQIFQDTKEFLDYYYDRKVQNIKILTRVEEGRIVSMMHRVPHVLAVKRQKIRADYIYAVATDPEYRKKGIMKELMVKALKDMYRESIPFTYLIPENSQVYQSQGFAFVYSIIQENFDADKQKAVDTREYQVTSFDPGKPGPLIEFSNSLLEINSDVFIHRDEMYYLDMEKRLKIENGSLELFYCGTILSGYCYLSNEGKADISEFVCSYKEKNIFLALLSQKYGFRQTAVRGILFPWEGCKEKERIMARILNVKEIGKLLKVPKEFKAVIRIKDSIIEENHQVFCIKDGLDGCIISESNRQPELTLEIGELAQWLFGQKEYQELAGIERPQKIFINDVL